MEAENYIVRVIENLLENTSDSNPYVLIAIKATLFKLSEKYPNDILRIACKQIRIAQKKSGNDKNGSKQKSKVNSGNGSSGSELKKKLNDNELVEILEIIKRIVDDRIKTIDGDVVLDLIELSIVQMIDSNTPIINSPIEFSASHVLVALGTEHCNQVIEGLMKKVISGQIPHYMIIHTIGSLALANCYSTVPYTKSLLIKLLPILPQLRFDHHKQAFSYAAGSLASALSEYLSNIRKAPDPTLTRSTFYAEFIAIYDILAYTWLPVAINRGEYKQIETILQALSHIVLVLPLDKIIEQLPRITVQLIALYRRQLTIDYVVVTKCLDSLLIAADKHLNYESNQLEEILRILVDQIQSEELNYTLMDNVKHQSELLRCFDTLFQHFPPLLFDFFAQHLRTANEAGKVKSLKIICHILSSQHEQLKKHLKAFVPILRQLVNEQSNFKSNNAKKVLLKLIVLLVYHNIIEQDTDLNLFLNYIVKLCSLKASSTDDEEFLKNCDNSLYLLATSSSNQETQLWQLFTQFLLSRNHKSAEICLIRCLSHLVTKFSTDNPPNTSNEVHLDIFVQCLELLAQPLANYQGRYVLNFLKNFGKFFHSKLIQFWDKSLLEILKFLEYHTDNLNVNDWEMIILKFVSNTVHHVDDSKWLIKLIDRLEAKIKSQNLFNPEKSFILLSYATSVSYLQQIDDKLPLIFNYLHSESDLEQRICATMIQICAKSHFSTILGRLSELSRIESGKKSSKFFGLIKDSRSDANDRIKFTLLLAFAQIATLTNDECTIKFLELKIMQWCVDQLTHSKESIRKQALRTIAQIAVMFNANKNILNKENFEPVIFQILEMLYDNVALSAQILDTTTALLKLAPPLKSGQKTRIFKLCFENVIYTLKFDASGSTDEKLLQLIQVILTQHVTMSVLEELFCLLQMWMLEQSAYTRSTALRMLRAILNCYLDNLLFDNTTNRFELSGFMCGCLVARLNDPEGEIRVEAVHCINLIMAIGEKYESALGGNENDFANTEQMITILNQITMNDDKEALKQYARLISIRLPHYQLVNFIESLLNGLLDQEVSSATGVTIVLMQFLTTRGGDLFHYVDDIVVKILSVVDKLNFPDVKLAALRSIATLAAHHPKACINALLMQPLGYQTSIPECWHILSEDNVLATAALAHFIRLISGSAVYDEQMSRERLRIAMHQPLAAICAISDMFYWPKMHDIAQQQFAELFCLLYISLASYLGVSAPITTPLQTNRNSYKLKPAKLAMEAFITFLICANCDQIVTNLQRAANEIDNNECITVFVKMVPQLLSDICSTIAYQIPKLLTNFSNYRTSIYEVQRIAVYTFYCEYVHQRANVDVILLETVVACLLEGQTDSSAMVRQMSLRGLSYLGDHNGQLISRHNKSILNAFINGIDEYKIIADTGSSSLTNIPLESLNGLQRIMNLIDVDQMNICVRIKPFFDCDDANLRAAAILLFGKLIAYSSSHSSHLIEQINNNLMCFLLHLTDANADVVKACNSTLRQIAPLMNAKKFNGLIQDHLIDDAKLNFQTFISALIKIMSSEILLNESSSISLYSLINTSIIYLNCKCPVIRANTAFVIGQLLQYVPSTITSPVTASTSNVSGQLIDRNSIIESVANRLITLLNDTDPDVRAKSIAALGFL